MKPISSKHDPSPYVAPAGDGSATGTSADPIGYAADPVLSMAWTQIPDFTGLIPNAGGGRGAGEPADASQHSPVRVSLPSIRAAEDSMLSIIETLVEGYNNLHEKVLSAIQTQGFYGEDATYFSTWGVSTDNGADLTHPDTNIQTMAQQFDQLANPMMSRALRQIADTITALGQVTNGLNLAGQSFTDADQHSYFPPPSRATITQQETTSVNDSLTKA